MTFGKVILGLFGFGVSLLSFCVCVQVGLVLCSRLHPFLELACHCSLHVLLAAAVLLPALIWLRYRGVAFCLAIATAYLLVLVQPWGFINFGQKPAEEPNTLQVLSWNVLSINKSFAEIEQVIKDVNPDVLILIEVRPGLIEALPFVQETYPHCLQRPSWGGEGIAICSRVPGTTTSFEGFDYPRQPGIVAKIPGVSGGSMELVALHTLSPLPTPRTAVRDRQLASVRDWSSSRTGPTCVAGDFNTTPWTSSFIDLLRSGFRDSRVGSGNGASWPAELGWLGIPIDHAITKGDCRISERRVLQECPGSDHRPIAFKLHF